MKRIGKAPSKPVENDTVDNKNDTAENKNETVENKASEKQKAKKQ